MKKILPKLFFPLVLILISVFLCFKNYSPGTYLIGWDSLHPEFNFPEAFRRVWEGVWRVEQGIGTIAAHSHMADLPRLVFLWIESFVIPVSFLRYSYIFLCLVVGPLGVYFFLRYVFQKEKESVWISPAAFLGALFYLLNLGTLQNFYVPFEMFPAAFAGLPWIAFSGFKYLREGKKPNLIFWAAVVILSSPMAYAATLWYASFLGLFIFFASYALISSARKIKFKRLAIIISTAVLLNLYWILPNIYSIANQSGIISNANINRLFSAEAFLRNRDYGDFANILIQKNFLFGWRNFDFAGNQFGDLLGVWIKHLLDPAVLLIGYTMAGISVLGLILGVIKRKKVIIALIPALVLALFFLININPPSGGLYAYFYNNFSLFAEGFRMPFSKFSILYDLIASFCFGYFVFIFSTFKTRSLTLVIVFVKVVFLISIASGLVYFMLPAFNGQLIGPNVRKDLPGEYQEVFNWFNSNSYGRVALLPINSKYGWEYRNWGYEGSGFLTFGTSDPILYRDFDRWGSSNEDFYNQASFALYSNDVQGLTGTLKKYQVKYLLLDESIINPGGSSDILKIPELKNIFAEGSGIHQVAKFGFLTIFETGYGADISAPSKFIQTDSDLSYSPVDPLYAKYGDYINTGKIHPVRKTLSLPPGNPVISEDLSINRGFADAYNCDLEKSGEVFKTNSPRGILYSAEGGGASCDNLSYPDLKYSQAYVLRVAGENEEGRSLKIYLFDKDSQVPDIEEVLAPGEFDETYFIYPRNTNGVGYALNLETRSFGRIPSENLLTKVEFYPVDYDSIQENCERKLTDELNADMSPSKAKGNPCCLVVGGCHKYLGNSLAGAVSEISNGLKIVEVRQYGIFAYKIDVQGSGLIQLGQSYDSGWIGFSLTNTKLQILNHVKVDSWANGWIVPASIESQVSSIYLVYWPQLLEWGGAVLGLAALFVSILIRNRRKSSL